MPRCLLVAVCLLACAETPPGSLEDRAFDGSQTATDAGTNQSIDAGSSAGRPPNILMIIADDFGVDVSPCYAAQTPHMPNLTPLCARGLVFEEAWSNPICSPTRATLMTGRYGLRTGVGNLISGTRTPALPLDEFTLAQALKSHPSHPYDTGAFGKWHLANSDNGGSQHPHTAGFDQFSGLLTGALRDYSSWNRLVNGETATETGYATTVAVDDALSWLGQRGEKPWFLWMAFIAPHSPWHLPPEGLHHQEGLSGEAAHIDQNPQRYYFAAAEALDTEMGRLLEAVERDHGPTLIVFLGDNGTPSEVLPASTPRRHGKGSLYRSGVQVPLVISGPGIDLGARISHPVNMVDLFPTLLTVAGMDPAVALDGRFPIDGKALNPFFSDPLAPATREWVYSELFGPTVRAGRGGQTLGTSRFHWIGYEDGREFLFDLEDDPRQQSNLLEAELSGDAAAAQTLLEEALESLGGRR